MNNQNSSVIYLAEVGKKREKKPPIKKRSNFIKPTLNEAGQKMVRKLYGMIEEYVKKRGVIYYKDKENGNEIWVGMCHHFTYDHETTTITVFVSPAHESEICHNITSNPGTSTVNIFISSAHENEISKRVEFWEVDYPLERLVSLANKIDFPFEEKIGRRYFPLSSLINL